MIGNTTTARIRLALEGQGEVVRGFNEVQAGLGVLKNAFVSIAGVMGAREYLQAADALTQLNNRLKLATGSTEAATSAYEALFSVAQRSRVNFIELGSTYATIARTTQTMGLSQTQLLTITEAIGNAMTISGGSAESMNAALVQLGQGLGSGTLRGEELNSVMEQTPRLAQAIADGMGIPLGALRQYAADGKLSAEAVTTALQSQAAVLSGEVQDAALTVGQAMTVLANSAVKTVGEIDKSTGISAAAAQALVSLSGAVKTVGDTFRENETVIMTGMGVLAGAATVASLGALVSAFGGVVGALAAVKVAFAGLTAVMAANPVGLALLGIVSAVGGFIAYNKAFAESTEGLEHRIWELQERIKAGPSIYDRDAEGMRKWGESVRAMQEEIAALKRELENRSGPALTGSVASGDVLLARAQRKEWDAAAGARAAYEEAAKSSAQKLSDELAKASKAFGGVIPPEIEQNIRAKFVKPMGAAKGAAKETSDEFARLTEQLRGQLADGYAQAQAASQGLNTAQTDFLKLAASPEWSKMTDSQRMQIAGLYEQRIVTEQATDGTKAMAQAQAESAQAYERSLKVYTDSAQAAQDRVTAMELENEALALSESMQISMAEAVELTTIARLKEAQAIEMAKGTGMDDARVLALQEEIDARKKFVEMLGNKEAREASARLREDEAREWSKTWDQVSQSFTDALMQGGQSVKQYLINLFRTMVLRPMLAPVGGAMTSMLGGPASAGQGGGGLLGGGGSPLNVLSNLGSSFNLNTAGALGGLLSSSAAYGAAIGTSSVAAGSQAAMLASQTGTFGAAGVTATAQAAGGAAGGLMSGLAAAAPWVLGAIALASSWKSLFGRKLKDSGLQGKFSGEEGFSGNQYQFYKGGLFRSNKTTTSALDSELSDALTEQYTNMTAQNKALAQSLGLGTQSLADFNYEFKITTNGLTEEQITEKLNAEFAAASDAQAKLLLATTQYTRAGETSSQTLQRLGGSLTGVNAVLKQLNQTLLASTLAGGDAASALLDQFGGMENFTQISGAYYQAYYTDAERATILNGQVRESMAAINLTMPATREGFRALVEAQDLTTESGRKTYASLLKIAPAFDQVTTSSEQAALALQNERTSLETRLLQAQGNTAELRKRELETIDPSNRALMRQVWALEDQREAASAYTDSANTSADAAREAAEAMRALGDSLGEEVKRLRGLITTDSPQAMAALQAQFATATAAARAGDKDALARLPELSQAIEQAVIAQAKTAADIARIRGQLAASLSVTAGYTGVTVPQFEVGTNYVPRTMLAQVHEGEAIIPKPYNPAAGGQTNEALILEVQGLRSEVRSMAQHTAKTARVLDRVAQDGNSFNTRVVA